MVVCFEIQIDKDCRFLSIYNPLTSQYISYIINLTFFYFLLFLLVCFFCFLQRVMEILTDHIEEKQFGISQGSGLDFGYLLRAKIIKDVYVLHNVDKRNELLSRWGQKTCW